MIKNEYCPGHSIAVPGKKQKEMVFARLILLENLPICPENSNFRYTACMHSLISLRTVGNPGVVGWQFLETWASTDGGEGFLELQSMNT